MRYDGQSAAFLAGGLVCLFLLGLFARQRPERAAVKHGNGLFSWRASALEEDEWTQLFPRMEELGLSELYQHIPEDAEADAVGRFLEAGAERGISVYQLTGNPSWGLDPSGRAIRAAVDRAAGYGAGLKGVMMDVEPYLTEEWDQDPDGVMEDYVKAMIRAKASADRAGLELIACGPYYYDSTGQEAGLERLMERGCHALAVMNYHKDGEAEHIETEMALAERFGRPVITIYELQAPGKHGLTERSTYYGDGLEAVAASWDGLRQVYRGGNLSYALHDYTALKEVLAG